LQRLYKDFDIMHNRFHTKNQQRLFTKYLQLQEKQDLRTGNGESNHRGRRGHGEIRVSESFCVSHKKNISVIHPMELLDYSIGGVKLEVQKTKILVKGNMIFAGQ
jgi:hypothetical protein